MPIPYTATPAVAFSLSLLSCEDKKNPVYATGTGLRTENYQLVRPVLAKGLAALQVDWNELQVELLASTEEHMMQLYCLRYHNNAYRFNSRLMALCSM